MIRAEGLGKRFGPPPRRGRPGGAVALRDVGLDVPEGACWAVVGPNGAGKSTLLGLLLGWLRPTWGAVSLAGAPPATYLRAHGVSVLPERVRLPDAWTPAAYLPAVLAAPSAREALPAWGLDDVAGTPWRALSTGTRQRVLLAQALAAPRALVVLDEPTAALDPAWRLRLRERLLELRAAGHTLLLASHDLAEVEQLADRVVVLREGRVRDVLPARAAAPRAWLLETALEGDATAAPAPLDERVRGAFPGAEPAGATGAWHVPAAGEAELSARLAALLDAGVVLRGLRPVEAPLEARVRRALEDG